MLGILATLAIAALIATVATLVTYEQLRAAFPYFVVGGAIAPIVIMLLFAAGRR